jgi:hypothetical protein
MIFMISWVMEASFVLMGSLLVGSWMVSGRGLVARETNHVIRGLGLPAPPPDFQGGKRN